MIEDQPELTNKQFAIEWISKPRTVKPKPDGKRKQRQPSLRSLVYMLIDEIRGVRAEIRVINARLDRIEAIVNEHTKILQRHELKLNEYGKILKRHGLMLESHDEIFKRNNLK